MVEELYTAFYEELLRYCVSMTGERSTAEDVVQDAYSRAMAHLEDLEVLSRGQRRAWLYKTARNLYIDQIRRRARETCVEEEQLALASFEEDMTRAAVQQLVSRLPESERALFSLRYFAGYNATELGDMFNLPPSTVRARLASARRKLSAWYYA